MSAAAPSTTPAAGGGAAPRPHLATAARAAYEEHRDPSARVLLFSERNYVLPKFQVAQYEFEDLVCAVDAVDVVAPAPSISHPAAYVARGALNAARRIVGSPKVWPVDATPIEREYELFFAVFHFPANLAFMNRLPGWRERCRKAVCFLIECWTPQVEANARYLKLLEQFDQVFVFNPAAIPAILRHAPRARLEFLPVATDALAFCPLPAPAPSRAIDVLSVGRRSAATHDALRRLAARRRDFFYHYDTVDGSLYDFREHRAMTAALLKRSRYFLAYRVNEDRVSLTGGEEAIPTRFFEGAAGGAVMLGSAPNCREFAECFDWPDASVALPWAAGDDVAARLAELDAQPERMARARRANVVNSLRRHDWVHRWARILDAAGLPPTPEMAARVRRLDDLAAAAESAPLLETFGAPVGGAAATLEANAGAGHVA